MGTLTIYRRWGSKEALIARAFGASRSHPEIRRYMEAVHRQAGILPDRR
ncbi:hypothetical protein [Halopolyspora algeriensis]|nr:hypothetical protein [Halopolyspora algeriensis]